jgi:spore maturation protein CgeB
VDGIEEVFDVGTEIDTWNSIDELRDKARWWLRHEDKRQAAGVAAQQRILHSYGNDSYARQLLEFVGIAHG